MLPFVDADAFRNACARFATGVTIATVAAGDGSVHGLTVSSFTAVSIRPPLVLICIDHSCTILSHFRANSFFAVNILSDEQREVSVDFSVKPEGRFKGVDWSPGACGSPLISGALASFECRLERTLEVGDHAVFVGEVVRVQARPGEPLVYFNRAYRSLR